MTYDAGWFHILHTADGVHVHELPGEGLRLAAQQAKQLRPSLNDREAMAEVTADEVAAHRRDLGAAVQSSAISPGVPHPTLLARMVADCPRCYRPPEERNPRGGDHAKL